MRSGEYRFCDRRRLGNLPGPLQRLGELSTNQICIGVASRKQLDRATKKLIPTARGLQP
jgi:hypothetical protein